MCFKRFIIWQIPAFSTFTVPGNGVLFNLRNTAVHSTLEHCKLYSVLSAMYTGTLEHCTLHTVHSTLYTLHCTLYTVYIAQCTLIHWYNVHSSLHVVPGTQ